jgi:site-specific DNA recombinase
MAALFIKDLAQKTHRGLEGRVRQGRSAGGISYGYRVRRQLMADGSLSSGEREIDPAEAAVIRQIYRDYARGLSARRTAIDLNKEGIPAPRSGKGAGTWSHSTISGNSKRGTGILNNELYIGRLVWNRPLIARGCAEIHAPSQCEHNQARGRTDLDSYDK